MADESFVAAVTLLCAMALFSPFAASGAHYQPISSPGDMRYRNPDLLGPQSSLKADARKHTTSAAPPSSPPAALMMS